ncbi:MAG: hypothetical protein GY832_25950 [Chloroflexi bacterium]|nr:hypothetical protein [Chloroflexota bacterium]
MTEKIGLQAVLEDSSFQAGVKNYNAGIDSMESANEGAIQSSAQLSSGLTATDDVMAASGGSAVDLAAKLDIAKQAFSAVQSVVATGLELAELGAMAQRVEKRFAAFAEEAGGAERILAAFQRGAGNTVSDMDAMASASRLLQMGLVGDADEMETVVEMASRLGDQTQSATDRVSDFALMLANQSIPRLDNFGISSGKVRARIAELQATTQGMTREAAFMQAVMEQGALSLGKLGPRVDDAASAFERNEAKMANLRVEMGQKLIPAAMMVTEAFSGLLDIAASMIDIVSGASIKIAGFTENLMSVAQAIPGVINPLIELSGTLETVTGLLDIQAAAQTADQMGTLSDATQVAEGYMGSWSVYAAEMIAEGASLGEVMAELARTQNDTSAAFESGGAVQAFFKDALVDQKGIMQETVAVTQAIALENALATGSYETYSAAIAEFNSIQTDANGAVLALTEAQFNMAQVMRDGASEASLLADEIFTSRLENQGYTSAVEESTRAVGELSGEFQNSGPPMREWAATSAELARAVEETTVAEAEAERSALAAAAAMEAKRQKDIALAVEETKLAQSVMGASDAMIAQTFIQGLDPDAMGLLDYRAAVENIQLAFGLATPESIALSQGLTEGMEAANQGKLAIEDLDNFLVALREDAADGAVDFNALGAEFTSAAGESQFLIAGMENTSTAIADAAEQAEAMTLAGENFAGTTPAVVSGLTDVTGAADDAALALGELDEAMLATADGASAAGSAIGDNLEDGLVPSVTDATDDAATELEGLDSAMADTATRATAAGAAIGDNLAEGLLPRVQAMVDEFTNMLQSGITDNLPMSRPRNPDSPLRALPEQGAAIVNSIGAGITQATPGVATAAAQMGDQIGTALGSAIASSAAQEDVMDELFGAGGILAGLGGMAGGMLQRGTIDPLTQEIEDLDDALETMRERQTGLAEERAAIIEEQRGGASEERRIAINERLLAIAKEQDFIQRHLNHEQGRRTHLAAELAEQEERILRLQEAQERLRFLEQQSKLLDLIAEKGLDAEAILGGLELGVDASVEDVVDAMTRAMEAIIAQANEELGIASPSKVFEKIGGEMMAGTALGIKDMMEAPIAQSAIATQAMVSTPAAVMGGARTSYDQSRTMGDVNVNNPSVPNQAAADQLAAQIKRVVMDTMRGVS